MNFAAITDGLSSAIPPVVGAITLIALSIFSVRFSRYAYDQVMAFFAPHQKGTAAADSSQPVHWDFLDVSDIEEFADRESKGEVVSYQEVYLRNLENRLQTEEAFAHSQREYNELLEYQGSYDQASADEWAKSQNDQVKNKDFADQIRAEIEQMHLQGKL